MNIPVPFVASPIPELLLERLARIKQAHAALARPWQVGHVISAKPLRNEQQENGPGSGPFSFAAGMTTAN